MNRLLIVTLLIASLTSCKNKLPPVANVVTTKDTLRILTYGLVAGQGQSASSFIAKKYGFCYYPIAGCVITKRLADSVEQKNDSVYKLIEQRYGKDWKKNFNKGVDSLSLLEKRVEALVNTQPFIQQINGELKNKGGLYYYISPADSNNIFFIKAYGFDTSKHHTTGIVYCNMKADLNSNIITSLE